MKSLRGGLLANKHTKTSFNDWSRLKNTVRHMGSDLPCGKETLGLCASDRLLTKPYYRPDTSIENSYGKINRFYLNIFNDYRKPLSRLKIGKGDPLC